MINGRKKLRIDKKGIHSLQGLSNYNLPLKIGFIFYLKFINKYSKGVKTELTKLIVKYFPIYKKINKK